MWRLCIISQNEHGRERMSFKHSNLLTRDADHSSRPKNASGSAVFLPIPAKIVVVADVGNPQWNLRKRTADRTLTDLVKEFVFSISQSRVSRTRRTAVA
jgi:hypothetical protein